MHIWFKIQYKIKAPEQPGFKSQVFLCNKVVEQFFYEWVHIVFVSSMRATLYTFLFSHYSTDLQVGS